MRHILASLGLILLLAGCRSRQLATVVPVQSAVQAGLSVELVNGTRVFAGSSGLDFIGPGHRVRHSSLKGHQRVVSLAVTADGRLWAATLTDLYTLDGDDLRCVTDQMPPPWRDFAEFLASDQPAMVGKSESEQAHAYEFGQTIHYFDHLHPLPDGRLLVAMWRSRLLAYSPATDRWETLHPKILTPRPDRVAVTALLDDGTIVFEISGRRQYLFQNDDSPMNISHHDARQFAEIAAYFPDVPASLLDGYTHISFRDELYVAAAPGLWVFDGNDWHVAVHLPPDASVTAFCIDPYQRLFVGTRGDGLHVLDSGVWGRIYAQYREAWRDITDIRVDDQGIIRITTPDATYIRAPDGEISKLSDQAIETP